jgi:substrate import-associated zinc metallohydrolase lipoprotein
MKRFHIMLSLLLLLAVAGCKKDEKIDFKFNKNLEFVPSDLDNWLTAAFTDTYNMAVEYRFDRYKGFIDRNHMPASEDKVRDQMEMVLKAYITPYHIAGGTTFVKTYLPKEWMLFGSMSIGIDGRTLATSGGGRNVTLYEVNYVNLTDPLAVRNRVKTIHHEFAHTLNQIVRMPVEFERISDGDYTPGWQNSFVYPDAQNRELGFVSRYARSSVVEDFAEVAGFLLSSGQLWYDNLALNSPKSGYDIMKRKEAAVVSYYRDAFGVDFRKVQREVAYAMHKDFNDNTFQSFENWFFKEGLFNTTLSTNQGAISPAVSMIMANFKAAAPTTKGELIFMFTRPAANATTGSLVVRVPHTGGNADYNFSYTYDANTHLISFAKKTGDPGTNPVAVTTAFTTHITSYLTASGFVMDWSLDKPGATRRDESFLSSAGFYKVGDKANYINFNLVKLTL